MEAAILETFIIFEPPEGPLGPLKVDAPQTPTERHARVLATFLLKTVFLLRRELDFRFPRESTSPKID